MHSISSCRPCFALRYVQYVFELMRPPGTSGPQGLFERARDLIVVVITKPLAMTASIPVVASSSSASLFPSGWSIRPRKVSFDIRPPSIRTELKERSTTRPEGRSRAYNVPEAASRPRDMTLHQGLCYCLSHTLFDPAMFVDIHEMHGSRREMP